MFLFDMFKEDGKRLRVIAICIGAGMFIAGLLAMNAEMTTSAIGLFGFSSRRPRFQFAITALTAFHSFAVGAFFRFGSSRILPPLG